MATFLEPCLIVAAVLGVVAFGVLVGRKYRRRRKRLVYLDQVALIKTGRRAASDQEFANSLYRSINKGTLTVVVSSWHLVETAHTSNINNAIRLADFIDSLKPLWLLERRNIQLLEVEEDFLRFAGVPFDPQPKVTTRSAALAALLNQKDSPRFDIPSRNFVKQWIEHPEQLEDLDNAYQSEINALNGLRALRRAGRLTDEISRRFDSAVLQSAMPRATPAGVELGPQLRADYLAQAQLAKIPTLAIESAISEHEWGVQGRDDRNSLIDKFHLISALPYVDEVVSDDAFFGTIYPVAIATRYVRARLLKVPKFWQRF